MRPIHYACKGLNLEIVTELIVNGVNLECKTKKGMRPIHYACKYPYIDITHKLIESDVSLECETKTGWKPIHYACKYSEEIMICLMKKCVDLQWITNKGHTAKYYACKYKHEHMYARLECFITRNINNYVNEINTKQFAGLREKEFKEFLNNPRCCQSFVHYAMRYLDYHKIIDAIDKNSNGHSSLVKCCNASISILLTRNNLVTREEAIMIVNICKSMK